MAIINVPSFLGERNTEDEKVLPLGSMSISENIDLDNAGIASMRDGFALSMGFTNITASFTTSDEQRMFIIDDGDLKILNDDFSAVILKSGVSTEYTKWLEVADYILMNNGLIIDKDNNVYDWRVPTPDQPSITTATGDLPAGQYQIVTTYKDGLGREGAASDILVINVGDNSSITVSPVIIPDYSASIYITDTDGEVLYLHAYGAKGAMVIANTDTLSYPIDRQQLDSSQLPDEIGSIAFYEGRALVSKYIDGVSYIYKSKPFWWHLFDVHEDYIAVDGKVTLLQGTPQGLIIGTDDEIYIFTKEDALVRLTEYGVVQGKPLAVTDKGQYYLWTKQGICTLFPFKNTTEDKVSLPAGCICSTVIIENHGYEQFLVLNDGSGTPHNKLN